MDRVVVPANGSRARCKLQDDAVATSILGWLCEQFPQTHVMPHLTDADLGNLASLGSVPGRAIRTSSRGAAVKSRLEWFTRVPAPHARIRTRLRLARGWRPLVKALTPCITPEENLDQTRQAHHAAEISIILNDGRLILYGPIHYKNQESICTGYTYPGHILKREVGVYYGRHIIHQRALGELDHPVTSSRDQTRFKALDAANVSHQILDCHWEGNLLMAYIEILDTPSGLMARDVIVHGIAVRCSARGWGTPLKKRVGKIYFHEDYELITFDLESAAGVLSLQARPLQRRYENLRPPIDVEQAIASFNRELERGLILILTSTRIPSSPSPPRAP